MGHTQVPNALVEYAARLDLKSEECWLICCVLRFKYSADNPRPTQETLARLFGQSVDTVQRTVKKIVAKKLLKVERARSDGGAFTHTIYDFTPLRFALNECYYQDHPQERPQAPAAPYAATPQKCGIAHTAEMRRGARGEPHRRNAAQTTPQKCGPNKKTEQQEVREDSSRTPLSEHSDDISSTSAAAVSDQSLEDDDALIACLHGHGVNRADAVRLVKEQPEECRRQLDYLPFVPTFTSGKGAYLRSAIEQGFGPPKKYTETLQLTRSRHMAGGTIEQANAIESRQEALLTALRSFRDQMEQEQPDVFAGFVTSLESELSVLLHRFSARAAQESYRKLYAGEIKRLERFAAYFATNPCPLPALAAWLAEHPPVNVAALLQGGR
jgi:hypothetical protein